MKDDKGKKRVRKAINKGEIERDTKEKGIKKRNVSRRQGKRWKVTVRWRKLMENKEEWDERGYRRRENEEKRKEAEEG